MTLEEYILSNEELSLAILAEKYQPRLRDYIDMLDEGKKPKAEWTISKSPIFDETMTQHLRVFPDLNEKLKKFTDLKLADPLRNRYGKHDGPMTGPFAGFFHAHLRDGCYPDLQPQGSLNQSHRRCEPR